MISSINKNKDTFMTTTIFHNPRCSTSRNALALIQASGETPEVVEYLKHHQAVSIWLSY